ncbi:MAG: hypothetical protein ACR2FG_10890 [Marmoricola sp.]
MRRRTMLVITAVLLVTGCGTVQERPSLRADPAMSYVGAAVLEPAANEDPRFSDSHLRDVVSVADHVVVVSVTSQRNITVHQSEQDGGDWHLVRTTLRVDRAIWSRKGATPAPASFTVDDLWRRRLSGTLVVPIVKLNEWSPLTGTSFLCVAREHPSPVAAVGPDDGWRKGVSGLSVRQLGAILAQVSPWPGVDLSAPIEKRREQADTGR